MTQMLAIDFIYNLQVGYGGVWTYLKDVQRVSISGSTAKNKFTFRTKARAEISLYNVILTDKHNI
ncbi:3864_t:CDS:2 [Entrophospora sp. SA101]|nr:3864_t:CDS:2 [Entrophospora sp. SA101]